MDLVSTMIRTDISIFDDATELQNAADTTPQDNEESDETEALSPRIIHGSPLAPCTLSKLELDHSDDAAFRNARRKLSSALAALLNIARVTLKASDTVRWIINELELMCQVL